MTTNLQPLEVLAPLLYPAQSLAGGSKLRRRGEKRQRQETHTEIGGEQSPSEIEGADEEFEVEAILDERLIGRSQRKKTQYLVKWIGYQFPT